MNHRQRAQSRLERHVPELRSVEARELFDRVTSRDNATEAPVRAIVGDGLSMWHRDGEQTRSLSVVTVSEHAPLLMRLVRHPYRLEPVRWGKVDGRATREPHARPEPSVPALHYRRELREAYRLMTPTEVTAHRPEPRSRPFATARQAVLEAAEEAMPTVTGLPVSQPTTVPRGVWSGAPLGAHEGGRDE